MLRAEAIAALELVDFVGVNEWPTAVETIKLLKPDFTSRARSSSLGKIGWRDRPGEAAIVEIGGA